MKRIIISIVLLSITMLPAFAISQEVLTAFYQFQRAIYYAKDISDMYPYVTSSEVQNLRQITSPQLRQQKLAEFRQQYLENPVFTEESKTPDGGIRLMGTGIARINDKRYSGKFKVVFKKESGYWKAYSRQFVSDRN